jgi:hypothetical protein
MGSFHHFTILSFVAPPLDFLLGVNISLSLSNEFIPVPLFRITFSVFTLLPSLAFVTPPLDLELSQDTLFLSDTAPFNRPRSFISAKDFMPSSSFKFCK